ncbi:MAG TPA: PLP-dependent aminotransferase family protein [Gaiellales bacterium]|jgi:GntR family transcriptional regulator/MocR family aminotransferase|nr:PLP-dependent aminotransferase family protein [Gaiellales bacterium]
MKQNWTTSGPDLHLALTASGSRHAALEHALRAAIREGRLAAGTRLPSTRALAGDLGLSRGTVVEAFAQLTAEGYLDARHGAGTWVADVSLAGVQRVPPLEPSVRAPRFSFSPGLPDLTSFPQALWMSALRQGLRGLPAASLGYGDPRGRRDLREQLAWYLARARGVRADPELVIVCAGFRHGLSLAARALRLEGARTIAMEDPCAEQHRAVAMAAALSLQPLPVDARGARTDLLDAGAAGAVLSPSHQFPMGVVLHRERRASAIAWANETGGLIVEDDYDGEFRYDRQPVGALQALAPERVVYGGTSSKTLAPGLRLAWIVVPPRLLEPIVSLRSAEDVHVSALEQVALCQLLRSGGYERHVRRMRARYRARRDRVLEMLARSAPVLAPAGISAGLGMLLELPEGGPSASSLVDEAARRSIELHSLASAYAGGRAPREGIVLGYGALPEHDFEAGLSALGELLTELLGA